MNCFFSTIGEKLAAGHTQPSQPSTGPCNTLAPQIRDIRLSSKEIEKKTNLLKMNKATGPDGISPRLLKLAESAVVTLLTSLYTHSIRESKVYNDWKVARITPVFKKDDEAEMGNYRPLSMLSVPSKILESCRACFYEQ